MNDLNDFEIRDASAIGRGEVAFAHAVARRYVTDPDDAADVAQDALVRAHRHRASFRGGARYTTWLYRIVATTAFDHLRTRRRRSERGDAAAAVELGDAIDPRPDAAARLAASEGIALARRALDELGSHYARVFRLHVEDGVPEEEVARQLGLTVATVKVRTHRARRAIRQRLGATVLAEAA